MIVVMTTWLPRLACSQPGRNAHMAPKAAEPMIASGNTTNHGMVRSSQRQASATPMPPTTVIASPDGELAVYGGGGVGRVEHQARLAIERMRLQRRRTAHHGVGAIDRRHQRELQSGARQPCALRVAGLSGLDLDLAAAFQQRARAGQVGELEARQAQFAAERAQYPPALAGLAGQLAASACRLLDAVEVGPRRHLQRSVSG